MVSDLTFFDGSVRSRNARGTDATKRGNRRRPAEWLALQFAPAFRRVARCRIGERNLSIGITRAEGASRGRRRPEGPGDLQNPEKRQDWDDSPGGRSDADPVASRLLLIVQQAGRRSMKAREVDSPVTAGADGTAVAGRDERRTVPRPGEVGRESRMKIYGRARTPGGELVRVTLRSRLTAERPAAERLLQRRGRERPAPDSGMSWMEKWWLFRAMGRTGYQRMF